MVSQSGWDLPDRETLRKWDPERIGPYTVLGRLGSGSMGQVYLGRSAAGRLVAVGPDEEHSYLPEATMTLIAECQRTGPCGWTSTGSSLARCGSGGSRST